MPWGEQIIILIKCFQTLQTENVFMSPLDYSVVPQRVLTTIVLPSLTSTSSQPRPFPKSGAAGPTILHPIAPSSLPPSLSGPFGSCAHLHLHPVSAPAPSAFHLPRICFFFFSVPLCIYSLYINMPFLSFTGICGREGEMCSVCHLDPISV